MLHAERERRVDAQQAAWMPAGGRHLVLQAVHGFDQPAARVEIGLALPRQRQLAGGAVDEPHTEPRFQTSDELRYGRGREPQIAGSAGKCAALDGAHEYPHFGQLIHGSCLEFTKVVPRTPHPKRLH